MPATAVWNDLTITTNLDAQLTVSAPDDKCTQISISWENLTDEPPVLNVRWSLPVVDLQYGWYPGCGARRALRVDWFGPLMTRISSSAPVFSFYNTAGRNRFTMALSDVLTAIDTKCGVHEEDGTLLCEVAVPLDATGLTRAYTVTLYRDTDDVTFAEALRRVSRWWEACGLVPMAVPDEARLPLYSAWYSFHQATIAHELEEECARAAKLGMKTIIVDDGWQTTDGNRGYGFCGDWEPTPEKIPDMAAHVAKVHALGMKYMLWYSVAFVGIWSKRWDEFKDMVMNPGNPVHNAGILDPRYPAVREYLIDTYVRALKAWDLDGFKLDFIDSFLSSADAPAPTPGMDYIRVEDAVVRLMTDVMNSLRAIKPEIMIEFRQSYIGPAMRTYGNMFRVGDCPDDLLSNRVGVVDLRLLSGDTAVHSDMLMWHKDDPVEAAARQILNIIFGVMQLSVKLDTLPEDHLRMATFWCDFMTRHRALLAAPIEVESPQNLYPVVRSCLGEEEAIGVYDRHVVELSDAACTYLFNATADNSVVLRCCGERALTVETFNCMGEPAGVIDLPAARLQEIAVPVSGYAVIR